jgi:uncharacterized protein (TIGR00730 family)
MMKRITVFCGSSNGLNKVYMEQAYSFGKVLAERDIELIYGGAKVGLMGAVADGVLQNGGRVTGVLPHFLQQKEVAHTGLTELILVDTMHERKLKMHELSDGVVALPGGFGTLEELFEMLTWGQLGLHRKPIAILNTSGFYNSLIEMADKMVAEGFLKQSNRDMLMVDADAERLLAKMHAYEPAPVEKWITPKTS